MRYEVSYIANLAHHSRTPKEGSAEEKATHANFEARKGKALNMLGVMDVLLFFCSTLIASMRMAVEERAADPQAGKVNTNKHCESSASRVVEVCEL